MIIVIVAASLRLTRLTINRKNVTKPDLVKCQTKLGDLEVIANIILSSDLSSVDIMTSSVDSEIYEKTGKNLREKD